MDGDPLSIPIATTTIAVTTPALATSGTTSRYDEEYDGTPPGSPVPRETGVRAVISVLNRATHSTTIGGEDEVAEFALTCDPTNIDYRDLVTDEATGVVYEVRWAISTPGVAGLSHVQAGLRTVKGRA